MSKELFQAIENKASYEEVKRILETHPEAVTVKIIYGCLPLHHALWYKASNDIIKMFF